METILWVTDIFNNFQFKVSLFILSLCWCAAAVVFWMSKSKRKYNLPPGPWGLPIFGYYPFLGKENPFVQLASMKKTYGPVMSMYLGRRLVVVLLDFPSVKEAYSRDSFSGRPRVSAFSIVSDQTSFADVSGELWKTNRQFTLQILRNLGFGKTEMESQIQSEISEMLNYFELSGGKPMDSRKPITSSMSNTITALLFGHRLDYEDPDRNLLDRFVLYAIGFFKQTSIHFYMPWITRSLVRFRIWNYHKAEKVILKFFDFVENEIESHRKTLTEGHIRDYIDGYIEEMNSRTDSHRAGEEGFTEEFLRGNLRSLFGAGSDTTRSVMEWLLVVMAAFPEYQKRVQQELDAVIGHDRFPSMADISETPLTQATIFEVLRWVGIVPLGIVRQVTKDDCLYGYDIPEGTLVMPNLWAIQHDPDFWDEPMTFKPERFLVDGGTRVSKPEHFIPFSFGRRMCPGETFGMMEVYLYFAAIMQKFQVVLPEEKKDIFSHELSISLQVKDATLCFLKRKIC